MADICDQESHDGSTASISRPLTKDSKFLLLFNFIEHSPGIGLISHVMKPILPLVEEDAIALMKVYIETKRSLAVRWKPASPSDTSSWHLTRYTTPASSKDTVVRASTAVYLSDDKDIMASQRSKLIKTMLESGDSRVSKRPKARSQLQFSEEPEQSSFCTMLPSVNVIDEGAKAVVSEKRPYEDIEQELAESDAKMIRLEMDNRELKQRIVVLEEENNQLKEDPLRILSSTVREHTVVMQRWIDGSGNNQLSLGQLPVTPRSSSGVKDPSTADQSTPVKLYGTISINREILRQATIIGRTKTQNPARRLNATVSMLLSAWWTKAELSLLSLAGKACPSIPGSIAKPKFPDDVMEAITKFLVPKWENWHKIILTAEQIKNAVGDRLLACHTSERKRKLQALSAAGVGDDNGSLDADSNDANGANNASLEEE